MSHSPPIVLTFAASDPTGGAGLQADLLTLASMGCHPLSVVTALTMQDTRGVEGILAVEADWVAGQAKHLLEDMRVAAFKLGVLQLGCEYVLVTGTHEAGVEVVNTLYAGGAVVREDRWQRLPGSYHGSGCTLASAIAAALANGLEVAEAVRDAQEYTWQALAGGFRPGMGQLLPDRFFWAREGEGGK